MSEAESVFASYEALAEWALDAVRDVTGLVIGCGALGSYVAETLASMGVGAVVLIDDDTLAPHNILRTACVAADDAGRPKVHAVADAIRRRCGDVVQVVPINGSVQTTLGAGLASRASMVFLCADNREARVFGCRRAVAARTPHVSGAIDGFRGLVAGAFDPEASACYECGLSERERNELMRVRFSCSPPVDERAPSVPTTPVAAQITASWMVHVGLAYLQTSDERLLAKRVFIDPVQQSIKAASYERRPDCPCSAAGPRPEPVRFPCHSARMSPRDLLAEARAECGGDASVLLDYALVTEDACETCGRAVVRETPRHEETPSVCAECGGRMAAVRWTHALDGGGPLDGLSFRDLQLPWLHYVRVVGSAGSRTYEFSGDAAEIGLEG